MQSAMDPKKINWNVRRRDELSYSPATYGGRSSLGNQGNINDMSALSNRFVPSMARIHSSVLSQSPPEPALPQGPNPINSIHQDYDGAVPLYMSEEKVRSQQPSKLSMRAPRDSSPAVDVVLGSNMNEDPMHYMEDSTSFRGGQYSYIRAGSGLYKHQYCNIDREI